jgi:hypothetical protein
MEILSDTLVKLNIKQKFVRCFSYYKEYTNNTNMDSNSIYTNVKNFVSLYPKMFLDSENDELFNILTSTERENLKNSRLINFEFTEDSKF